MDLTIDYMQQAIVAARSVEGKAMRNPPVGAAIVGSGKIVGLGATQIPGQDHAEIVALKPLSYTHLTLPPILLV